uniref:Leucine-rich repeat-containing protein 40 n=1 Tax=Gadus morhua TaxID=8049 RepID=A0A8C5AR12_GADMO
MSRFKRGGRVDSLSGFQTDKAEPAVPNGLLNAARKSGQLNLSGRGLTEVPQNVYRLNVDTPEEANKNLSFGADDRWWEQTDLIKLLLSSNQLTTLSDDIRLLPGLTTLDLHDNKLTSLPGALGELEQLQQLRLSNNQLSTLPVEMCRLHNLHSLTLQKNLLETLPEELGQLDNLTELKLDLSHNLLTSLPDSLAKLASENPFMCLTSSETRFVSRGNVLRPCCAFTGLKLLDCSNNQLTCVPASLSEMTSLEQLYLRHNKLRLLPQLPATILKELYLGNNQIERLEAEQLASLAAISLLELRDNKIQSIPEEVTLLATLTRLDLTNNDVATLPASLSLLPNLKVLMLEGNPLRGIRRDLLSVGHTHILWLLSFLEEPGKVDETPTAMTLPSQARVNIHNLQTLKILDYSEKQSENIPDEVFDAAAGQIVTTMNFSKNQLTTLPPRLAEFQGSLTELNLGFNKLSCLSPAVSTLMQLTHLDLRNNQLSDLPSDLGSLKKLRSVILNYNKFKCFPDVLYEIVSLETVLLGNNQVGGLDAERLKALAALYTLDLSNNDLLNVAPELGLCTSLRCLSLDGNPFRTPRAAIVAKGTDAVMEYLRSRIPT